MEDRETIRSQVQVELFPTSFVKGSVEKECNSVFADVFAKGSPSGGGLTRPYVLGEC